MTDDANARSRSLGADTGLASDASTARSDVLARFQAATNAVLEKDAPTITESFRFDGEGIDSLDLIEIMMELEDSIGVVVDAEDLDGLATVGEAIDMILTKRDNDA